MASPQVPLGLGHCPQSCGQVVQFSLPALHVPLPHPLPLELLLELLLALELELEELLELLLPPLLELLLPPHSLGSHSLCVGINVQTPVRQRAN